MAVNIYKLNPDFACRSVVTTPQCKYDEVVAHHAKGDLVERLSREPPAVGDIDCKVCDFYYGPAVWMFTVQESIFHKMALSECSDIDGIPTEVERLGRCYLLHAINIVDITDNERLQADAERGGIPTKESPNVGVRLNPNLVTRNMLFRTQWRSPIYCAVVDGDETYNFYSRYVSNGMTGIEMVNMCSSDNW